MYPIVLLYLNIHQVTVFKSTGQYDPSDLSTCDLDIAADVERLRVMVVFQFLSRVQVHTLLHTFYVYVRVV